LEGIKENMKVVLIGYRAAGKTTVGKLLAMLLKVPFYDADSVVEEIVNVPVKNIVAHQGWEYFRKKETEAIHLLSGKGHCVIATGGGVILDEENVKLLKQSGVIVWLNAPIKDIIDRLNEDAQNNAARPQFTTDDLAQETLDIFAQRLPLYKKTADFMVGTAGKSAPQIAEIIYHYLLESGIVAKINKKQKLS
jgi:shikimate kinase